jgi:L-cysteine:1D-myo-inositol 2-amino-2-deoxy-alpha-D-glucopyranoside ligase
MRLYDTRRGVTAALDPGGTVSLYVCGITPYEACHLGHAFTYTVFDVLVRYLRHSGHRVRYARNITDVDDDMLRVAREQGQPFDVMARAEAEHFDRELAALGLVPPDVTPWASEAVPAIITAVGGLLDKGSAYALPDGRVYFDTHGGDRLGGLSRLDRAEMLRQFAEKGGDPEAPDKRDPLDFLLWQPSLPDEPRWAAPWGEGRPGWHIECSVMAAEELGAQIDIHGGGRDLVFPHHEAEILQAEHLTGQEPFARFWLHTGMVGLDGEKMSKSLGNLVFIGDLLERYEPGAVRRYLLAHRYRTDWDHDESELGEAAIAWKAWQDAADGDGRRADLTEAFHAALRDDLDVPQALTVLDEAARVGAGATVRDLAATVGFRLDE